MPTEMKFMWPIGPEDFPVLSVFVCFPFCIFARGEIFYHLRYFIDHLWPIVVSINGFIHSWRDGMTRYERVTGVINHRGF